MIAWFYDQSETMDCAAGLPSLVSLSTLEARGCPSRGATTTSGPTTTPMAPGSPASPCPSGSQMCLERLYRWEFLPHALSAADSALLHDIANCCLTPCWHQGQGSAFTSTGQLQYDFESSCANIDSECPSGRTPSLIRRATVELSSSAHLDRAAPRQRLQSHLQLDPPPCRPHPQVVLLM